MRIVPKEQGFYRQFERWGAHNHKYGSLAAIISLRERADLPRREARDTAGTAGRISLDRRRVGFVLIVIDHRAGAGRMI
jgi:hypothetical protein